MNEFKSFITVLLGAIALMLTIAASSGSISYGVLPDYPSFYAFAGVCNLLGWGGLIVYKAVKFFKSRTKSDSSEPGGFALASPDHSDNKTDEVKTKE